MKNALLLAWGIFGFWCTAQAQTFIQVGTSTNNPLNLNSATTDGGPIHGRNVADAYSSYFYVVDSNTLASLPSGARITRIDFHKGNASGTVFPHNNRFEIWLRNSSATTVPAVPVSLPTLVAGATKVYSTQRQAVPNPLGYVSFVLEEPFLYSGAGLEMAYDWEKIFPVHLDAAMQWSLNTVTNSVIGYNGNIAQSDLVNARNVRPTMRIYYELPTACSTPVAGTIVSSSRVFCGGSEVSLRLGGNFSLQSGLQFRWQISSDNLNWTDQQVGTQTILRTLAPSSIPNYYRCIVTCGSAADTTPVFTMSPALPMSGVYTVDANQPASLSNFTNLSDAIEQLNCQSLIGPVTLLLANGTYTGNFFLNTPLSTQAITIESLSQIADSVVLEPADNGQVFAASNAANLMLRNLSFRRNALPASAIDLVSLGKGTNNAVVIGCKFAGVASSISANNRLLNVNSIANGQILQNTFRDGYYGVHNANTTGTDSLLNLQIKDNQFTDIYASGIFMVANARGTQIEANTFRNNISSLLAASTLISLTNHIEFNIHSNVGTGNIGQSAFAITNFTGDSSRINRIFNNALSLNFSNATPRAFFLTGGTAGGTDYLEIYHNSVQMRVNSTSATRNGILHVVHSALQSATIGRIIHRNNVYSVISTNAGGTTPPNFTAYYFPDAATQATYLGSHNAFNLPTFSGFAYTNSPATTFATLTDWQTASGQEVLSFNTNPLFTALEDLRPLPNSPLKDAGVSVAGIGLDLLGFTRNLNTPTIGAYEVILVGNDAALLRLVGLTNVQQIGNRLPVRVWLQNQGQTALSSLQLSYQLGSGPVVNQSFSGNLAFLDSTLFAFTDSISIPASGSLRLSVWCAQPNGQSDFNTANDTLIINFCTPLATGTYTVGSTSSDFPTMNGLLDRLYCAGISGPVTIQTQFPNKTSNQRFELLEVPGTSATNRLIFDGQFDTISLTPNAAIKHLVLLNGAKFTTFQNFVLRGLDPEFGIGMIIQNSANNNIIRNNRIDLSAVTVIPVANALNASSGIVFTGSLADNTTPTLARNNLIDSNLIIGGHTGVRINGSSSNSETINNRIVGNIIRDFSASGVFLLNTSQIEIAGNQISRPNRVTTTTFTGISVEGAGNQLQVHRNVIFASHTSASSRATPATGIRLSGVNPTDSLNGSRIFNNLIYELNSSAVTIGIQLLNTTFADLTFNTIDMGSLLSSTGASRGISLENNISGVRILSNNIHQTRNAGSVKHAIAIINTTASVSSNRNNLYVTPGASGTGIGLFGATNLATLADWQTQGYDANSFAVNPAFVNLGNRDYVPQNNFLNGTGAAVPYVTVDFTGASRNLSAPDMGAFEFTPVGCPGPAQITLDSVQVTSALINWVSSASSWELEYGPVGFTPGTGTRITGITSKPYLLTGLVAGGCYAVFVRDSCIGQFSPWAGPLNFCTLRTHDLAMLQVLSPTTLSCPDSATTFRFVVKNEGLNAATNFAIRLDLTGGVNLTANFPIQSSIAPGATDTLVVPSNLSTFPGGQVQAVAFISYSLDQNSANDTLRRSIQMRTAPQPQIQSSGTTVCAGNAVTLWNNLASGATNIGWFDAANNLLANADTLIFTPQASTTITARPLGVINGQFGPANTGIGSTVNISGITVGNNRLNLRVDKPVILRGFRIYPQQSGVVRLVIRDAADVIIRVDSILVSQGTPYTPIDVSLNIPLQPGSYSLAPTNNQSAGAMTYSSSGAAFPYNFGNYASITGTNGTNAAHYYYFYNMLMDYGSCSGASASQSIVVNPQPTAAFSVDSSSVPRFSFNANASQNATSFSWNFGNGQTATGPTASVTYTQNGSYQVRLIATNACGNDTLVRTVRVVGLSVNHPMEPMTFSMYPNPSSGLVLLQYDAYDASPCLLHITDMRGRTVLQRELIPTASRNEESIDLQFLQSGIYQLSLQQANRLSSQKLVIQK